MLDVAALYRSHGRAVRARIRRFFPEEETDDVLQEVFMRVIDKRHTFRGDSSPSTWLYQLTTRHCLNRKRNRKRRTELWPNVHDLDWADPVRRPSQEQSALLTQLWEHLDEDIVMVGIYYYLDGFSQGDIAKMLGCSRQTVGYRLQKLTSAAQALDGEAP